MDVPFATGDAPGTDATTTVITVVVSAGATAAVASAKLIKKEGDMLYYVRREIYENYN